MCVGGGGGGGGGGGEIGKRLHVIHVHAAQVVEH